MEKVGGLSIVGNRNIIKIAQYGSVVGYRHGLTVIRRLPLCNNVAVAGLAGFVFFTVNDKGTAKKQKKRDEILQCGINEKLMYQWISSMRRTTLEDNKRYICKYNVAP